MRETHFVTQLPLELFLAIDSFLFPLLAVWFAGWSGLSVPAGGGCRTWLGVFM